jgi:TrmH family RNA methyltransferase
MLSKAQIKYIRSLTLQKFRNEFRVFAAEGEKMALEWLHSSTPIKLILATEIWVVSHRPEIENHPEAEVHIVKNTELEALSALKTPNEVMLVIPMPEQTDMPVMTEWCLALEDIRDPGNMGTIIRIADWFGIRHIACSPGCVDIYNPKVVQSAMGGHLRVNIHETELLPVLASSLLTKIAAVLDGESVYRLPRTNAAIIVIGNESKGLSKEMISAATIKASIPRRGGAESLNAGVSAGILCALLVPC